MLFLKYHLKFPLVLCAVLSCVRLFVTPWMQAPHLSLLFPWDSSGKNAGVGCHFFFQDLPEPGIELVSPDCWQILYH